MLHKVVKKVFMQAYLTECRFLQSCLFSACCVTMDTSKCKSTWKEIRWYSILASWMSVAHYNFGLNIYILYLWDELALLYCWLSVQIMYLPVTSVMPYRWTYIIICYAGCCISLTCYCWQTFNLFVVFKWWVSPAECIRTVYVLSMWKNYN